MVVCEGEGVGDEAAGEAGVVGGHVGEDGCEGLQLEGGGLVGACALCGVYVGAERVKAELVELAQACLLAGGSRGVCRVEALDGVANGV